MTHFNRGFVWPGHESDQMFEFDGSSTAVSIPNSVLNHSLSATFTIATWMRHGEHNEQDKHVKEHILCSADDHSKYIMTQISHTFGRISFEY